MYMTSLIFFVYPDPKGSEENQFTPPRLRVAASAEQGWGWCK